MIPLIEKVFCRENELTWVWSIFVFYITWFLITRLKNWVRIYFRVLQLPGPTPHLLLGNYELMCPYTCFKTLAKWRDSFPGFHKGILAFYPFIIAQSADAVQAILSRKAKHNEKAFPYLCVRPLFGDGLLTTKGERWQSHRKLISPTFHFDILEKFLEVFITRTEEFMKQLDISLADKFGEYIDISPFTRKLTLDFICETALGAPTVSNRQQHEEVIKAMHKLEETSMYRLIRPWLLPDFIFRLTQRGRDERSHAKVFDQFTKHVITQRREALLKQKETQMNSDEGNLQDSKKRAIFMDLLLAYSDGGTLLSDKDIQEETKTFIMAGQNTIQLAINYCLYLLGENPDVQAKAYEELYRIFGDSDRQPTMEDLKSMKYLENCVKDALRLFPSIPAFGRRLTEDEEYGKFTLPKGIDVVIVPYVLHRDPAHFPNPEKFNPDNFLPEVVRKRHPYAYIPFSAGPRNCIGQKYALLAEKTVLSTILRKYSVKSLQPREELVLIPILVLVPKNRIKIMLTPRKPAEVPTIS